MANIESAKRVMKTELNNFTPKSIGKIERIIAELDAASIDWRKNPGFVGLHKRYTIELDNLEDSVKRSHRDTIIQAKARQSRLRGELDGLRSKGGLFSNPAIKKQLQALGVLKGNRAVFESTQDKENIEQYLDYLNYIHQVKRDKRGAIKNPAEMAKKYRELINEGTDWILDKKYIQFKYAEAIQNDIIRRGYVLQKNATGQYTIVCPKIENGKLIRKDLREDFPNHPYLDIVNSRNTRNLLDVAMVTSMISKNTFLEGKGIIGQETLISSILANNHIKSRNGVTIQKAELLKLDWNDVKRQIDEKLAQTIDTTDGASMQVYNELMYVRNFIEHKEYEDPDYSTAIFSEANVYRKGFLTEKALLDAFGGNIENVTPKNFMGVIKNMGGDMRSAVLIFAALAFIGGFKKIALGAAGIGLLGPSIAGIIETGVDGVANKEALYEKLEIIRPHTVVPILENSDHQEQFEKLTRINKTNLENSVDDSGRTLPYVANNFIIAKILNEVHKSGKNVDLSNSNAASELFNAMQNKGITNSEFPNYRGNPYNIKLNDLKAFIKLTKSDGFKESGDATLGDVFSSGLDIRNKDYESRDFSVDKNFNTAINNHLRQLWGATHTEKSRKLLKKLQNTIEVSVSTGVIDNFFDAFQSRKFADVIRGLPERLNNIDDLILKIKNMGLNSPTANITDLLIKPATGTTLDPNSGILVRYKTYMQADAEMSKYDGVGEDGKRFISGNWGDLKSLVSRKFGNTGVNELETEKNKIDAIIKKINPATFNINEADENIKGDPLFQSIVKRSEELTKELNKVKNTLQKEIDKRNGTLRDSLLGGAPDSRISSLDAGETTDEYRNGIKKIMKAHREFKEAVGKLNRTGNVTEIFNSIGEKLELLKKTRKKLQGMSSLGTAALPNKAWLLSELDSLFKPGKEVEILKEKAKTAFTDYFLKLKTARDEVNGMNNSFVSVDDLVKKRKKLQKIESDVVIDGNIWEFVTGSEELTKTEKAYKQAKDVFGSSFHVGNDTITAKNIIEKVVVQRTKLVEGIQQYLNNISAPYTINQLQSLQKINLPGKVIDFARETELGIKSNIPGQASQTELDYATKLEEVTLGIIDTIPATPSGITTLIKIENALKFDEEKGLFKLFIEKLTSTPYSKTRFDAKVGAVGSSILRTFSEDKSGLQKIIDFKNGGGRYAWIEGKSRGFEGKYKKRVEKIVKVTIGGFSENMEGLKELVSFKSSTNYREIATTITDSLYKKKLKKIRKHIKDNVLTKDPTLTISGRTLKEIISQNARRGNIRGSVLSTFAASASNKRVGLLIEELNIKTNPVGTGSYTPNPSYSKKVDEQARVDIYNALKALNILD